MATSGFSDLTCKRDVLTVKNTFIDFEDEETDRDGHHQVGGRQRCNSEPLSFKPAAEDIDLGWCPLRPRRSTVAGRILLTCEEIARQAAKQLEEQIKDDSSPARLDESLTATPVDAASERGSSEGWRTPSISRSRTPSPIRSRTPSPSPPPRRRVSFAAAPAEVLHITESVCCFEQSAEQSAKQHPLSPQADQAAVARHRAVSASATCSVADIQHGSLAWRAAVAHGSVIAQPTAAAHGFVVAQSGHFALAAACPSGGWGAHPFAAGQVQPQAVATAAETPTGRRRQCRANEARPSGAGCLPPRVPMQPGNMTGYPRASRQSACSNDCRPACHALPGSWASTPLEVHSRLQQQAQPPQHIAGASFADVVASVRASLLAAGAMVKCVETSEAARGWTLTAYVQPVALKVHRPSLLTLAQEALLRAAEQSGKVFVLGYAANPFSPVPLGVGAAMAEMQDRRTACGSSFCQGFCDSPGTCCRDHPRHRTGVHIVLKPARNRAGLPRQGGQQ